MSVLDVIELLLEILFGSLPLVKMVHLTVAWEFLLYFLEFWVLVHSLAVDVDLPAYLKLYIKHASLLGECPDPQDSRLECLVNFDDVPVWVKNHVIHISDEICQGGVFESYFFVHNFFLSSQFFPYASPVLLLVFQPLLEVSIWVRTVFKI